MDSLNEPRDMTTVLRRMPGGSVLLAVAGDLDDHATSRLGALDEAVEGQTARVVVDLSEVTFFCSAALIELLRVRDRPEAGLTITNPARL